MTTLRTRWEKQDYTGVTAEVPLGHFLHPKISQTQHIPLTFVFPEIARLLNDVSRSGRSSYGGKSWLSFENGVLPTSFWAVFSSISGTHQIADLAIFLMELAEAFQRDRKTVCETPVVLDVSGFCSRIRVRFRLCARLNLNQARIKRRSTANICQRF